MIRRAPRIRWPSLGVLALMTIANAASSFHSSDPQYLAAHWTSENGLPENTICCLLQTRDGYIWAGTADGLARFDGVKFTDYREELAMARPPELRVLDLVEDGQGTMWIRTSDGVVAFQRGRFTRHHFPAGPLIAACCASRFGGLWLSTSAGVRRFENGRITRQFTQAQGLKSNHPDRLTEDAEGRLWMGFRVPGDEPEWQRLDPRTGEVKFLSGIAPNPPADLWGLFIDRSSRLWGINRTSLSRFENGRWLTTPSAPDGMITATDQVSNQGGDEIWLGLQTSGKIAGYVDGGWMSLDPANGLGPGDLRCVLSDSEGGVWAGTGSGLWRFHRRRVSTLAATNAIGARNEVYSVHSAQDHVWLGTSFGLSLVSLAGEGVGPGRMIAERFGPEEKIQPVLEDRAGRVWFGGAQSGLWTLEGNRARREQQADIGDREDWRVTTIFESVSGDLWIGSSRGLLRRHNGRFTLLTEENGLPENLTGGIREGPDGTIWMGSLHAGAASYKDGHFTYYRARDGLSSDTAFPLLIESNGCVWIGTPAGLNRIQGHSIGTLTVRTGLPAGNLLSLLDDGAGNFWAHSSHGLWRVSKAAMHSVADGRANRLDGVSFGESDGMVSAEGNGECQPNSGQAADGSLWFATTAGAAVVETRTGRTWPKPPPPRVLVEEVLVDDEPLFLDGASIGTAAPSDEPWRQLAGTTAEGEQTPQLRLSPGRARVLEIRYTANTFNSPGKIKFLYRLEGHDPDWRSDDSNRRAAIYTNLRPGDYYFRVKAGGDIGGWNESDRGFRLHLAPHFYETWVFYALTAGVLTTGALGVHQWRLRQASRLQTLAHQNSLQMERSRIARDMHDDLGAGLAQISLLSGLPQTEPGAAARVAGLSRQLLRTLDEIVWAVNPGKDRPEHLINYLSAYAGEFLAPTQIRCRLDFPEHPPATPILARLRHHLFLAFKEALHNVLKHSQATEVAVRLRFERDDVELVVSDNGRGFDPGIGRSHRLGLTGLRQRAAELGGELIVRSEPGKGATLIFRAPLGHD